MKAYKVGLLAIGLSLASSSFAAFDFDKVRLLSNIPLSAMPGSPTSGAGGSGWVSPGGREYGVMGVRTGAVIYDITNPVSPLLVKFVQGSTSLWHENVCLDGYAYLVSDQSGAGMQIVDMNNADVSHTATLVGTYAGGSNPALSTVHTIQANPQSKTLYLNGSNRGLVFLDVTNPTAPVERGRWAGSSAKYVHDSFAVNYTSGPFAGREILFACCGRNGLYILDVTNKATPVIVGSTQYLASGTYCHSGTLTPDKKYFLVNDELDEEEGSESDCTTHVIDVQDLTHPFETTAFHNPLRIIDHNSNWQDGYLILSAYRGGVRIYDPTNPLSLKETGYFDTYNGPDDFSFDGDWGLYSKYPSGNIILTDINAGLFVVDPSEAKGLGANLTSLKISTLTPINYTPKTVRKADGSRLLFRGGVSSVNYVEVGAQTASKAKDYIDVTVSAVATDPMEATILVKNYSTGFYDTAGVGVFDPSTPEINVSNIPGLNHIDANGNMLVKVSLRAVNPPIISLNIDMIRARVHGPLLRKGR